MTKRILLLPLAVMALSLTSCANYFIRKECESVNWYQHAYDVAMGGKRLSGDPTIDRCRKAEFDLPESNLDHGFKAGMSNYCKPEIVFTTGKQGDFFNTDLCDPGQASVLRRQHADGVKAYCAVGNGFNAGSSGKKYQNICPANLEPAFLKEYKRGRKSFLSARISTGEKNSRELDEQAMTLERERTHLSFRRNMLPAARQVVERSYNPTTGLSEEKTRTEDPSSFERNRLDDEIRMVGSKLDEIRSRREGLRRQLNEDQMELATLE